MSEVPRPAVCEKPERIHDHQQRRTSIRKNGRPQPGDAEEGEEGEDEEDGFTSSFTG